MTHQDPIALWLATSFTGGLAGHIAIAAWYRRSYQRLRTAYVGAISHAQQTGDASALVHAQELHRQFMRASPPSWVSGISGHLRAAFVLGAIAGVTVMTATGRLPPAVAGVALLFAIGLRRILLATALLLALFAVTSLTYGPPKRSVPEASARATHSQPTRPPPAPFHHAR